MRRQCPLPAAQKPTTGCAASSSGYSATGRRSPILKLPIFASFQRRSAALDDATLAAVIEGPTRGSSGSSTPYSLAHRTTPSACRLRLKTQKAAARSELAPLVEIGKVAVAFGAHDEAAVLIRSITAHP